MTTTVKRVSFALTKEDLRELEKLSTHFEETPSQVIRRALILLNYVTFLKDKT